MQFTSVAVGSARDSGGEKMNSINKTSRILGIAFLLQFFTSFINGAFLLNSLIVPEDIGKSMINIANNTLLFRTYILVDMLTALGIIFLGAILFKLLE